MCSIRIFLRISIPHRTFCLNHLPTLTRDKYRCGAASLTPPPPPKPTIIPPYFRPPDIPSATLLLCFLPERADKERTPPTHTHTYTLTHAHLHTYTQTHTSSHLLAGFLGRGTPSHYRGEGIPNGVRGGFCFALSIPLPDGEERMKAEIPQLSQFSQPPFCVPGVGCGSAVP